jgi:hypothetical protein
MEERAVTPRGFWTWILVLAASVHGIGILRTLLPAQDGLKFLRVAKEFQTQPWADVVRNSDQHPLYPASIALVESAVEMALGRGPTAWRVSAQLVSSLASVALLVPLFYLTRLLFDEATARLGVVLFVLLPGPAALGHDTLSDALALLGFTTALWLGLVAIRTRGLRPAIGCGLAAGLGYWTRPEVAVLPVAVLAAAGLGWLTHGLWRKSSVRGDGQTRDEAEYIAESLSPSPLAGEGGGRGSGWPVHLTWPPHANPRPQGGRESEARGRRTIASPAPVAALFAALAIVFLAMVGSYALVKGEVSEKLALRKSVPIASKGRLIRTVPQWLPPGLADPRWDFSAKEERAAAIGPARGILQLVRAYAEQLGWCLLPLAAWGAWRARAGAGRGLIAVYVILFAAVLVRHAMSLGYLSGRHVMTLVLATLPWAAAGILALARDVATRLNWDELTRRTRAAFGLSALVALGLFVQAKPAHASRWGHWAAGKWLSEHAHRADAVLDTRGWASFISGCNSYDFWHVRQALTDSKLSYIVVASDELAARSRRAETLRAILAYAAEPVAAFPDRETSGEPGVWIYRFHRPESWEGLHP